MLPPQSVSFEIMNIAAVNKMRRTKVFVGGSRQLGAAGCLMKACRPKQLRTASRAGGQHNSIYFAASMAVSGVQ